MKIIVVFPTTTESQFFSHPQVFVDYCGVGLSAAAYNTTKIIARHKPDWLILAGIAGAYKHSGLSIGDVALVASECEADLGFFTPEGFVHLADLELDMDFTVMRQWDCPDLPSNLSLPVVRSNSMNAAMAPFVSTQQVDIENMEGAAFFQVCLAEEQAFLEVRAVSNYVNIHADEVWDFTDSIKNLSAALTRLVDDLLAGND